MTTWFWRLNQRTHGRVDGISCENIGHHYLGMVDDGWQYYIMDDFGDAIPTGGSFACL